MVIHTEGLWCIRAQCKVYIFALSYSYTICVCTKRQICSSLCSWLLGGDFKDPRMSYLIKCPAWWLCPPYCLNNVIHGLWNTLYQLWTPEKLATKGRLETKGDSVIWVPLKSLGTEGSGWAVLAGSALYPKAACPRGWRKHVFRGLPDCPTCSLPLVTSNLCPLAEMKLITHF